MLIFVNTCAWLYYSILHRSTDCLITSLQAMHQISNKNVMNIYVCVYVHVFYLLPEMKQKKYTCYSKWSCNSVMDQWQLLNGGEGVLTRDSTIGHCQLLKRWQYCHVAPHGSMAAPLKNRGILTCNSTMGHCQVLINMGVLSFDSLWVNGSPPTPFESMLAPQKQGSLSHISGDTLACCHTLCKHVALMQSINYNGSSCLCSISIPDRGNVIVQGLN